MDDLSAAREQSPKWCHTNRQTWHQAWAAMTEVRHVPLDRRGTPRTCYLVADKFGFANSQTVAPPALGDTQQGRAAAPGGTAAAQSSPAFRRQSAKAAAAGRNKGMGDAATQAAVAIAVQEIERRIATATPPNRLTTQRRLLQRAGGDAYGCSNEALWVQS